MQFVIAVGVHGMTKNRLQSVSFELFGKKGGRPRHARRPEAGPQNAKKSIMIWSILFCAYGAATAALQYPWTSGIELLRSVIFHGVSAGLMAAAFAAFICIPHNRKLDARHAKPVRSRF